MFLFRENGEMVKRWHFNSLSLKLCIHTVLFVCNIVQLLLEKWNEQMTKWKKNERKREREKKTSANELHTKMQSKTMSGCLKFYNHLRKRPIACAKNAYEARFQLWMWSLCTGCLQLYSNGLNAMAALLPSSSSLRYYFESGIKSNWMANGCGCTS